MDPITRSDICMVFFLCNILLVTYFNENKMQDAFWMYKRIEFFFHTKIANFNGKAQADGYMCIAVQAAGSISPSAKCISLH